MPHHDRPTDAPTFQLDLPPLERAGVPEGLHAFAAATVWLALGVVGLGLVGGLYLGA